MVDLRTVGRQPSLADPHFAAAVASLAAPVHGVSKADLVGEERRQQARFCRIRNVVIMTLVVLLTLAALASYLFWDQRNTARAQRDLAVARNLTAQSAASLESDPRLARLLAVAAVGMAPPSELGPARAALRKAVRNPARFILPNARSLPYAYGGHSVAVARDDGSIELTDAHTGAAVAQLPAQPGEITAMVFSRDGKRLAVGGTDAVDVWDVASRNVVKRLDNPLVTVPANSSSTMPATLSWFDTVWRLMRSLGSTG